MGKGRTLSNFDWYLYNKNEKKRDRKKDKLTPDSVRIESIRKMLGLTEEQAKTFLKKL